MPDAVNIPLQKGSLRLIETHGKLGRSQRNITPSLHAVRAGAMAIKISLGNSRGQAQKAPTEMMRAAEISPPTMVTNIDTSNAQSIAVIADI
jgi:hypothetical protein